jgi:[ribosomal protein S5]-alanine N-acetyltransferase
MGCASHGADAVTPGVSRQVDTPAVGLTTSRLLVRDFRADDEAKVVEYFSEREARAHILKGQRSPERMSTYVKLSANHAGDVPFSSRPHLGLAIVLRDTRELIGICSLSDATEGSARARIGWHLSTRFSGFGYATEVARELIRFAFEERKVARVFADCYESNAASVRVFVKLGMQPSPALPLLKWFLALKYMESKPIVRYSVKNPFLRPRSS